VFGGGETNAPSGVEPLPVLPPVVEQEYRKAVKRIRNRVFIHLNDFVFNSSN
jgi:hypothetical protein